MNFKPITHAAGTDDAAAPVAQQKTTAPAGKKRAKKASTNTDSSVTDPKNLPWDHPDHPLNDPARQPSPTNPAVPVAEFVPQAAPTTGGDAGDDLTGDTSTTNTSDVNNKDNHNDGTDAD